MATTTHRRNRPRGSGDEGTVPLQGRVPAEVRQQAREAANAAGVSLGLYLELLVRHDAEHRVVRPEDDAHVQEALTA